MECKLNMTDGVWDGEEVAFGAARQEAHRKACYQDYMREIILQRKPFNVHIHKPDYVYRLKGPIS